ncbi:MAG: DNA polymerase III subunit delta [Oscillospiraceae bacterium]
MVMNEMKLKKALDKIEIYSVFYLYSCDEYLVQSYGDRIVALLSKNNDAEITKLDGPCADVEEAVSATGAISLFGTKRIVYLSMIELSAMSDKDVDAIADLCASLENAVVVITTLFRDDKAKTTKKAKLLISAAEKYGIAADLVKPSNQETKQFAIDTAQALNTKITDRVASKLVERCGQDYYVLKNEISKLAAITAYSEITEETILDSGTLNIEADVFELVRLISGNNKAICFHKLDALLQLQNDPIAITGALSGSFIDMYRMKCAEKNKKNYTQVHKDFAYKGSDYRLRKAGETACKYSKAQLNKIIEILLTLDLKLKSSAVDNIILLQTALGEIIECGDRR